MTYGYIYKISFPNNKIYIGLTTTSIEQRHKEHKSCALGKSTYLIYNALRKYDMIETFELEQIDTADTLEELCEKEKEYIKQYNSHYIEGHGYNMTYGGEGFSGYIRTEDDKKKMSESQKKRFENPDEIEKNRQRKLTYFKNNPEAILKMTERIKAYYEDNPEAREKVSERMKEYYKNPDVREKVSERMKEYYKNPEAGRIQGDKMKAYYEENPEAREKVSERMKEYYKNPDAREKMSEIKKAHYEENPEAGRIHGDKMKAYYEENPEARLKASEAQKKRFENPEARRVHGDTQKKRFENPDARRAHGDKMKKHHQENPNMRYEILDKKGLNKPFDVFTNDGTFIKTFNYQIDAQKYLQDEYNIDKRIRLDNVLSGKRKSTNGFVFKYKEIGNI